MGETVSRGLICLKNNLNIEFAVCRIDYYLFEKGSFKYVFTPYYEVIDLLDSSIFQGIPGLNLDLRKKEYVRENITPVFISERVPSPNREDYYKLLDFLGMEYINPIEYLIKSRMLYSGDNFYLKEYREKEVIKIETSVGKSNVFAIIRTIVSNIALGNSVFLGEEFISSKEVFDAMLYLYEKAYWVNKNRLNKGIESAKKEGKYKGRKPTSIDRLAFIEQLNMVEKKKITAKAAARNLGISIDKYYRYKKELEKNK